MSAKNKSNKNICNNDFFKTCPYSLLHLSSFVSAFRTAFPIITRTAITAANATRIRNEKIMKVVSFCFILHYPSLKKTIGKFLIKGIAYKVAFQQPPKCYPHKSP